MNPIKVAIVNDYELVVHGLSAMLAPFDDRVQVVAVEIGGLPEVPADIALFDTFAGRRSALARVDAMAKDASLGKVVLYTWDLPDEFASDIGRRAIDAVILKSTSGEQLVEALERVHRNEPVEPGEHDLLPGVPTLSEREREVLALLGSRAVEPTDRRRAVPVGRHRQDPRSQGVRQARGRQSHAGRAGGHRRGSDTAPAIGERPADSGGRSSGSMQPARSADGAERRLDVERAGETGDLEQAHDGLRRCHQHQTPPGLLELTVGFEEHPKTARVDEADGRDVDADVVDVVDDRVGQQLRTEDLGGVGVDFTAHASARRGVLDLQRRVSATTGPTVATPLSTTVVVEQVHPKG